MEKTPTRQDIVAELNRLDFKLLPGNLWWTADQVKLTMVGPDTGQFIYMAGEIEGLYTVQSIAEMSDFIRTLTDEQGQYAYQGEEQWPAK